MRIVDGRNMDRDYRVEEFNKLLKKDDDRLYCAYDYEDGFYKVYKDLPYQLWGIGGDYEGRPDEGFFLFTIQTPAGNPRPPHKSDIWTLRAMRGTPSFKTRGSSWWKKYQV